MIYLDNNAATRLCDEALTAMLPWLRENWSNPSSTQHTPGRLAGHAVEAARHDLHAGAPGLSIDAAGMAVIAAGVLSMVFFFYRSVAAPRPGQDAA